MHGLAFQRRPLVDEHTGHSVAQQRSITSFESPDKPKYNRQAGTGKVTRLLRATFAAGDSILGEHARSGSDRERRTTFGEEWSRSTELHERGDPA